jgi:hypothetical protein
MPHPLGWLAVLREPGEPVPTPEGMTDAAPVIRVGQAGDWVIAIEEDEPPQGIRPEALRRVSAGPAAGTAARPGVPHQE